ncbi:MAG: 1-acyl-sn-glycerol-3-phosphate acyltransferase [Bacteroidetes bacterium]|nr:1-acyl-sn-glycerol-3-phosphate acyltransferase [Bacteroidota bacterium]
MRRHFLLLAYRFFARRRSLLFILTLLIFAFFAWRGSDLEFREDILSFLPKEGRSEQISYVYRNVSVADKWMISLKAAPGTLCAPPQLAEYADTLAAFLRSNDKEGQLVSIFYKIDNEQFAPISSFITDHLPVFLDSTDYLRLDTLIRSDRIAGIMEGNRAMLLSPAGSFFRELYARDPLHISNLIFPRLLELQPESGYPVIEGTLFTKDSLSVLMICSSDQQVENTAQNETLTTLMERAKAYAATLGAGNIRMSYFSAAAIGVGNAQRIKKDSWLALGISLFLIALLFGAFFRAWRPIIYLMLPVLFGAAVALGGIALLKGYVSAIALGAGSSIIGISLNYSLHFVIHRRMTKGNKECLGDLITPLTTGSLTTIGAFLSLLFLSADSLRDFGLLATLVLSGTLLFVLLVLPHLSYPSVKNGRFAARMEALAGYTPETNRLLLWSVAALTLFFAAFMHKTGFNGDLQSINYMTSDQRKTMAEFGRQTGALDQAHYLVSEGGNLDEAIHLHEEGLRLLAALRDSGSVLRVQGIGDWVVSLETQQRRWALWQEFWRQKPDIVPMLQAEASKAGFKLSFMAPFVAQVQSEDPEPVDFGPLIDLLFKDYLIQDASRVMVIDLVYPAVGFEEAWSQARTEHPDQFLFDKGSVAKQLIAALTKDFDFVLYVCAFLVFGFLLISFRSLDLSLLAFLPMLIGWVWILGLMGLFGLQFNIVNVILATFIFGLGDDYSIFIIEGLSYEYAHGKKMLHAYKTAVLLSALTMFIGVGSLVVAQHPAMRSLGQVTVIGMISVVVISYTISPLLFRWMTLYKGKVRVFPVTAASILRSVISFGAYIIFGIYLWLIGLVLKHKVIYHKQLCGLMRFCARYFLGVKFRVLNPHHETFEQPAVVIANHQSQLDLMYALALTHKLVVITNQWAWNSPFYRGIIRYADFIPMYEGVESSLDLIRDRVSRGYSVLVFPQGHRAGEGDITRFHQGAFYIAEQLHLPILPLLLHGAGYVLPKGSLFLNRGAVHVEIGARFIPDGGVSLRERAKDCRSWYQTQYLNLHRRVATPQGYFWLLRQQYFLRGEEILSGFLKRWRESRRFESVINGLPSEGTVVFQHSGYGYDALAAALMRPDLEVYGVESDPDLRQVAASIALNPPNLHYKS